MNYHEFLEQVRAYFEEQLGEEYHVRLNEVMKNNGKKLTGLSILEPESSISPNIYLNPYYEMYIAGIPMEEIYARIQEIYEKAKQTKEIREFQMEFSFENQKENIIIRLIHYEKNLELLNGLPYIRFLDLAVTFHCIVHLGDTGLSSIPVTIRLMEHWETSVNELMRYGLENSKRLFPMSVLPMQEVLFQMFKEDMKQRIREYFDLEDNEEDDQLFEELRENYENIESETQMYVMTNNRGINGAAVILYEEAFKEFAESVGKDLYLIPSSIHEFIIIPYDEFICPEDLRKMVVDVNDTEVPYEDILSEQIYFYSLEKSQFQIITNTISA